MSLCSGGKSCSCLLAACGAQVARVLLRSAGNVCMWKRTTQTNISNENHGIVLCTCVGRLYSVRHISNMCRFRDVWAAFTRELELMLKLIHRSSFFAFALGVSVQHQVALHGLWGPAAMWRRRHVLVAEKGLVCQG